MSLRVISGSARGAQLKAVPGDVTRPIMDRVKEALFNIIGDDIFQSRFLDLFAGTGSVGIEALSRGAEFALFVDDNRSAIATVRENLRRTRLEDKAVVRKRDAFHLLKKPPAQHFKFVYVAPPQYEDLWWKTLTALDRHTDWHHPDTNVIVQIDPQEYDGKQQLKQLMLADQRKYGRTLLLFYRFVSSAQDTCAGEQQT